MVTLLLLNGAPGVGKSTVAAALAARRDLALALDVDTLKHALGGWEADQRRSGLAARRLALALAARHLADGHDVVVAQYVARPGFVEELRALAPAAGATFHEVVLRLDETAQSARLLARSRQPTRPEHHANIRLTGPDDVATHAAALAEHLARHPDALIVDASGSPHDVATAVAAAVGW